MPLWLDGVGGVCDGNLGTLIQMNDGAQALSFPRLHWPHYSQQQRQRTYAKSHDDHRRRFRFGA